MTQRWLTIRFSDWTTALACQNGLVQKLRLSADSIVTHARFIFASITVINDDSLSSVVSLKQQLAHVTAEHAETGLNAILYKKKTFWPCV